MEQNQEEISKILVQLASMIPMDLLKNVNLNAEENEDKTEDKTEDRTEVEDISILKAANVYIQMLREYMGNEENINILEETNKNLLNVYL